MQPRVAVECSGFYGGQAAVSEPYKRTVYTATAGIGMKLQRRFGALAGDSGSLGAVEAVARKRQERLYRHTWHWTEAAAPAERSLV